MLWRLHWLRFQPKYDGSRYAYFFIVSSRLQLYLGMPNAPATDMANFEIEVIDMARNNYTPIGYYRNGEFKPHQVAAPAGGDEEED